MIIYKAKHVSHLSVCTPSLAPHVDPGFIYICISLSGITVRWNVNACKGKYIYCLKDLNKWTIYRRCTTLQSHHVHPTVEVVCFGGCCVYLVY